MISSQSKAKKKVKALEEPPHEEKLWSFGLFSLEKKRRGAISEQLQLP